MLAYFIITTIVYIISSKEGYHGISLRLFGGGDDGFFYWTQAVNVANGEEWIRTSIYPYILGILIKLTGIEDPYIIRLFNFLGFVLLVKYSIKLINLQYKFEYRELNDEFTKKAVYSSILLLLYYVFYASLQMQVNLSIYRDVWIYLLYTSCIFISIKWMFTKQNRTINLIILLLLLWLLGEFRAYALVSFIISVFAYFAYKKFKSIKRPVVFILLGLSILIIYYTFLIDFQIPVVNMSLRDALNYRHSSLDTYYGGSQMWIRLDQPNIILFAINYIYSFIGNIIGPLPWHINGAGTWTSLIAISNDNIGTATRLRAVAWILILIVFVVEFVRHKRQLQYRVNKLDGSLDNKIKRPARFPKQLQY